MTEEWAGHHDLCFISDPPSQECICERLQQAENYARIAVMHTVDVDSYEQGRNDALAAAREAVAEMMIETVGNSAATVAQALAAIDALRDKP